MQDRTTDFSQIAANAPALVAFGFHEFVLSYKKPEDPRLLLFMLFEAVEGLTRFLTITVICDLAREGNGSLPLKQANAIIGSIDSPSFASWRDLCDYLVNHLPADSPLLRLQQDWPRFREAVLRPPTDGETEEEVSLIELRNMMSHGGGLQRERADTLLGIWTSKVAAALHHLSWISELRLWGRAADGLHLFAGTKSVPIPETDSLPCGLIITEGQFAVVHDETVIPLFPLGRWSEGRRRGMIFPQVFARRNGRGKGPLRFVVMGDSEAIQILGGEEEEHAFETLTRYQEIQTAKKAKKANKEPSWASVFEADALNLVGRRDDLALITAAVRRRESGIVFVTGQAGIGKSALAAAVSETLRSDLDAEAGEQLLVFRFKDRDDRSKPMRFLKWFAEELGAGPDEIDQFEEVEAFLDFLGTRLARRGSGDDSHRTIVILDGLDELARGYPGFLPKLAMMLAEAPGCVTLATTRPGPVTDILTTAGGSAIYPHGLRDMSKDDLRDMLTARLPAVARRLVSEDIEQENQIYHVPGFLDTLVERAQGLPLYVELVAHEAEEKNLSLKRLVDPDWLPVGVLEFLGKLTEDGALSSAQGNGPFVACTLAMAREPLSAAEIGALVRRSKKGEQADAASEEWRSYIDNVLRRLGGLLRVSSEEGEERYRLLHTELEDFVIRSDRLNQDRIEVAAVLAEGALDPGDDAATSYLYQHGPVHFLGRRAGDPEAVKALADAISAPSYETQRSRVLGANGFSLGGVWLYLVRAARNLDDEDTRIAVFNKAVDWLSRSENVPGASNLIESALGWTDQGKPYRRSEVIELARCWLVFNFDDPRAGNVLTKLIKELQGDEDILQIARDWVERHGDWSVATNVIGALLDASFDQFAGFAHDWVRRNSKATGVANIIVLLVNAFPQRFTALALDWIQDNPDGAGVANVLERVLDLNRANKSTLDTVLDWLRVHQTRPDIAGLLQLLMTIEAAVPQTLTAARAWLGNREAANVLDSLLGALVGRVKGGDIIAEKAISYLFCEKSSQSRAGVLTRVLENDDLRPIAEKRVREWLLTPDGEADINQFLPRLLEHPDTSADWRTFTQDWIERQDAEAVSANVLKAAAAHLGADPVLIDMLWARFNSAPKEEDRLSALQGLLSFLDYRTEAVKLAAIWLDSLDTSGPQAATLAANVALAVLADSHPVPDAFITRAEHLLTDLPPEAPIVALASALVMRDGRGPALRGALLGATASATETPTRSLALANLALCWADDPEVARAIEGFLDSVAPPTERTRVLSAWIRAGGPDGDGLRYLLDRKQAFPLEGPGSFQKLERAYENGEKYFYFNSLAHNPEIVIEAAKRFEAARALRDLNDLTYLVTRINSSRQQSEALLADGDPRSLGQVFLDNVDRWPSSYPARFWYPVVTDPAANPIKYRGKIRDLFDQIIDRSSTFGNERFRNATYFELVKALKEASHPDTDLVAFMQTEVIEDIETLKRNSRPETGKKQLIALRPAKRAAGPKPGKRRKDVKGRSKGGGAHNGAKGDKGPWKRTKGRTGISRKENGKPNLDKGGEGKSTP